VHYLDDVIIWDLDPGAPSAVIQSVVQDALIKAWRCTKGMDLYEPMASTLKTLHQERDTGRTRDLKPGEDSIYDDLHHEGSSVRLRNMDAGKNAEWVDDAPPNYFYGEADAAEVSLLLTVTAS